MGVESAKGKRFLSHLEPLQAALEAYGRHNLHDPNEIEDALQSAVANAYRDFHLYVEGTNFRAWIFRFLNLEIFSRNRRHKRTRHQALPAEPSVEPSWENSLNERLFDVVRESSDALLEGCDEVLADAVRGLDPMERSTFLLRVIGEFKYREIAEILDVPIGTVMSHLARSRVRLRRRLLDYGRRRGILNDET